MIDGFASEIAQCIEEHETKQGVLPISDCIYPFRHITFSVSSISEYLEVVELMHAVNNFPGENLAFRGVSDYRYHLEPSLKVFQGRSDYTYDLDYNIEQKIVDEMLTTRPEEFAGVTSNFDLLAKMQHLGLPTRLLDFSLNPLVALYFACQSLSNTTARVICTRDTSSPSSKRTVEHVCGLRNVTEFAQIFLEDIVGGDSGFLEYMVHTMVPLMAHPKCISERIKRQSGIFMIFPNIVTDRVWYSITSWGKDHPIWPYNTSPETLRIIEEIEARENPYEIYDIDPKQDLMGYQFIVSPHTHYKARNYYDDKDEFYIHEGSNIRISEKVKSTFMNRYEIRSTVARLSDEIMESCFCSILIDPNAKKSIMRELDHLNINEAFLFPEPEYTAKRIKNKYLK